MIQDKTMLKNKFMIALVFSVLCTAGLCMGEVVYVDANAPGTDNGESWVDAYTDLQSALGDVVSGDEIWVAAGVYKPGISTTNSFIIVDGVDMYGGFAGDEVNLDDRDWLANKTCLSGEMVGTRVRVVYAAVITNSAIIDGFEISSANWGIWVSGTNLSMANCTVRNNNYDGIYATGDSTVDITDCAIDNNNKHGIFCNGLVDMTITGSIVGDNGQDGINCYGQSVVIKNNWIHHNGQDGIYCSMPDSSGIVQNNTIVYNGGSGIHNNDGYVFYTPTISNCIFWGNDDEDLYYCEATYSCIEDPDTGDGVIHSDPCFASSNPELRDFHLSADSNCIDVGDPYDVYTGQVDIDGQMRVAHGGSGYGRIVDIGGDELAGPDIDTLADINVDGIVDLLDYAAFGPTWDTLSNDPNWDGRCNLEVDDVIDTADYVIFINEWLWEASWRASEEVFDFAGHWME